MHTSAWQSIAATKLPYAVLDPRPRRRLAALIADAIVLDALGYHIRYVQGYLNIVQVEAARRGSARPSRSRQTPGRT